MVEAGVREQFTVMVALAGTWRAHGVEPAGVDLAGPGIDGGLGLGVGLVHLAQMVDQRSAAAGAAGTGKSGAGNQGDQALMLSLYKLVSGPLGGPVISAFMRRP